MVDGARRLAVFHVCSFEQIAEFAPETIMLGSTK